MKGKTFLHHGWLVRRDLIFKGGLHSLYVRIGLSIYVLPTRTLLLRKLFICSHENIECHFKANNKMTSLSLYLSAIISLPASLPGELPQFGIKRSRFYQCAKMTGNFQPPT